MIPATRDNEKRTGHVSDTIVEFRQQVRTFFDRDFSRLDELIRQLQQPASQSQGSAMSAAQQRSPTTPGPGSTADTRETDTQGTSARSTAASRPPDLSKNVAGTESRRTGSPLAPQADRLAELANRITDRIRSAGSNSQNS